MDSTVLMNSTVVIIGGSHAAVQAIISLRANGWEGNIALVEAGTRLPYQRPPLSKKYLNDGVSEEQMNLRPESFYLEAGVDLYLGREARVINRTDKQVVLDSGDAIDYVKVIIATGTRPRRLPLPGVHQANIGYLRTMKDADHIAKKIRPGNHLLIIGAGYIGLELAASAVKQNCKVTVLEAQDRVLARVTCPVVSRFYESLHAQEGVEICLATNVEHFEARGNKVSAVLTNGERIDADQVVVGIGVIPNVELAEISGLRCENGIVVNQFTQTADPDIYAVGDCANYPSERHGRRLRLESVPNAVEHAKTAAASICGRDVPYDQVPWFWSDQYDVKLQTVGLWDTHDATVVRGDPLTRRFSVFYFLNGRLIAVDAINSAAEFMISKKLIAAGARLEASQLADINVPMKSFLQSLS